MTSRPAWVLVVAVLGSSLIFIDGTVVNVALPALQDQLDASVVEVQWVVEAYALLLSSLLLLGGALGDRFGRRRLFGLGMAVFAGASVWCGLSPSIGSLVAARALQGLGGALLTPGSLALISAAYPEKERGPAIGLWSGASGMAAAIGPLAGGWLIDRVSWRWAFFVNVPLAAIAFAMLTRVPESRDEQARGVDVLGAILGTVGLGGLVFGLIESSRTRLGAAPVVASLGVGALAIGAFVIVEARVPAPMLPLAIFRSRPFATANLLTLLLYAALGGALFFLPFDLIQVQGYSATAAGASLVPFVIVLLALSRWAGGLVERSGARGPLVVGPAVAALGFALLALPGVGGPYWRTFLPGVLVLGLGMAVTIAPLTTTVMNAVDSSHAGLASGVNNAVSRTAGLVAVAVFGIVLYRVFSSDLGASLGALDLPSTARRALGAQRIKLAAIEPPPELSDAARRAVREAVEGAFVRGFRIVMLLAAALAAASAAIAWIGLRPKDPPK